MTRTKGLTGGARVKIDARCHITNGEGERVDLGGACGNLSRVGGRYFSETRKEHCRIVELGEGSGPRPYVSVPERALRARGSGVFSAASEAFRDNFDRIFRRGPHARVA